MNAVLSLSADELKKGVATHSSGNHAQALARAAKLVGVKAYIVMPRTSPEIKKRGVLGFGGEIFECDPTLESRESMLAEVVKKTGATEIHPFNNYAVIAGQATAAKELFEDQKQSRHHHRTRRWRRVVERNSTGSTIFFPRYNCHCR